jgi:hypothetical protein
MSNVSNDQKRSKQYFDALAKIVASLISAVPESQRRPLALRALREISEDPQIAQQRDGTSVVFPVLAVPDDATVSGVLNMVSGMGASILSLGQAKPSSTVREVMDMADVMMGKKDVAFVGDPNGVGVPVAAAIAAAASADPDIAETADRAGLSRIIAELSSIYDCASHKGPLAMVEMPKNASPLSGGLFDFVSDLFDGSKSERDKLSDKADRRTNRLSNKEEKLDEKISDIDIEIKQLKADLSTESDPKKKKRIQRKIERLEKKKTRKETKKSKVQDKLDEWKDVANDLKDDSNDGSHGDGDTPIHDSDEGRTRREIGEDELRKGDSTSILAAAKSLVDSGVPSSIANILAGYFVPKGTKDVLSYISKLASQLDISLIQAAKYSVYVLSGMEPSDALRVATGYDPTPPDLKDFLEDIRAKNEAYRTALQNQMAHLRDVNQTAADATRMYARSEWADAIMSSSDEVADLLQKVAPDASSTDSFLASLTSLLGALRIPENPAASAAIRHAIAQGNIDPAFGFALTGDPSLVPMLVVAAGQSGSSAQNDVPEATQGADVGINPSPNPVVDQFLTSL